MPLQPNEAFDNILDQFSLALGRVGIKFVQGPHGEVFEGSQRIGRILSWQPGKEILVEWHGAPWQQPEKTAKFEFHFEAVGNSTRVTLQLLDWSNLLDESDELSGWFATELLPAIFKASGPERFSEWLTDRRARRPMGPRARTSYRDPTHHRPNFLAILDALKLNSKDYLLEVGCGGGAFLHDALKTGCKAAAIDHSPEMVRLAREVKSRSTLAKPACDS
jgi:hypothetical protein